MQPVSDRLQGVFTGCTSEGGLSNPLEVGVDADEEGPGGRVDESGRQERPEGFGAPADRRRERLDAVVAQGLFPLALGIAAFYGLLVPAHLLLAPPEAAPWLALSAALSAALLGGLGLVLGRRPVALAAAHPIATAIGAVGLWNCAFHLYLVPEAQQTINFALLEGVGGLVVLSRRWLAAALGVVIVTWFALAWRRLGDPEWLHFAYVIVGAGVLAAVAHEMRLRGVARLEATRRLVERRGAQVSAALDAKDRELQVRRVMETKLRTWRERSERHKKLLFRLASERAISAGDLDEALRVITLVAHRALATSRVAVWLYSDDRQTLTRRCSWDGWKIDRTPIELRASDLPTAFAAIEGSRVVAAQRVAGDPRTIELAENDAHWAGMSALLAASIRTEGRLVGVFACVEMGEERAWRPEDETFAGSMADFVAMALEAQERVRAEAELRELARKLEHTNRDLEQFAYAASHDLQEPLRMVTSYLQLLERRYASQLDADGRRYIDYAVDGARRMRQLIQDLLALSRAGRETMEPEPVDLDELIGTVAKDLGARLAECGGEIHWDGLPTVSGDRSQLHQLFQNLIGNALKYRRDEPPRVKLRADRDGSRWLVSIRDNGIGFEPEQAERIFRPFQRLHARDEYSGSGIGLSIVRRVAERHGGHVSAMGEPGVGACFVVALPAEPADADAPGPLKPPGALSYTI